MMVVKSDGCEDGKLLSSQPSDFKTIMVTATGEVVRERVKDLVTDAARWCSHTIQLTFALHTAIMVYL